MVLFFEEPGNASSSQSQKGRRLTQIHFSRNALVLFEIQKKLKNRDCILGIGKISKILQNEKVTVKASVTCFTCFPVV